MIEAAWGGPQYPNASTAHDAIDAHSFKCPRQGCLFDVVADPTEKFEISQQHPEVVDLLHAELEKQAATIWEVPHAEDPLCRKTASALYGGFLGPWAELDAWKALGSSGPRKEQR